MVDTTETEGEPVDTQVEVIARKSWAIWLQIKELQAARDLLSEELRILVGEGRMQKDEKITVAVGLPTPSVKVDDGDEVPVWLKTLQPDKKKILQAYEDTRLCPPGVTLNPKKARVSVHVRD